jgi:PAS domain S-box-containing protein
MKQCKLNFSGGSIMESRAAAGKTIKGFRGLFLLALLITGLLLSAFLSDLFVYGRETMDFDHMFDEHGLVMLIIDSHTGRILNANHAAADFYGYTIPELETMTIHEINQLDDASIEAEMSAAAAEDRNYFVFEHRLSDGAVRTVEVYSYPYVMDGRPLLFSIIHDITPRLTAEQEAHRRTLMGMFTMAGIVLLLLVIIALLLKNRAERNKNMKELFRLTSRYKTFIAASNTGAWEYNKKNGTMTCSPEYYALRGIEISETDFLVGTDLKKVVFNHIHPDDRKQAMKKFYNYIDHPVGLYENEFRIKHQDGSWRWILSRGKTLLDEDGKRTEITVGTHIDITANVMKEEKLRESEFRFKQLAEQSRTITWEVDASGLYTYVSDVAYQVLGYQPDELVNKFHYYDLHPPEGRDEFRKMTKEIIQRKQSLSGYVNPMLTKDNKTIYVTTNGGPLLNEDGTLRGYWGSDIDVTELHEAKEIAESANQAKSVFLGNMTHELKTPLHGVIGANQLLETTQLTEEQKQYVDLSKQTSQMLLKLINDILDYTKLESDYIDLQPAEVNLFDLIEKVNQLFRMKAAKKNLTYTSTIDQGIPAVIIADEYRIRQILINLLGNAVKFTDKGSIYLWVSQKTHSDPRKIKLQFRVTDTGRGITGEQTERIFERFHQVPDDAHTKYEGTGLGLPISKNLAELMGGTLNVASEEGIGSTFVFECVFDLPESTQLVPE